MATQHRHQLASCKKHWQIPDIVKLHRAASESDQSSAHPLHQEPKVFLTNRLQLADLSGRMCAAKISPMKKKMDV